MEHSSESRTASVAIVGLFLTILVGLIITLGSTGALAAPADDGGLAIPGIVR